MRPFGIEFIHESIEAGLLRQAILASRLRCFFLQGQVHALVPAILLGMSGFDPLDRDAQTQPKDREP